MPSLSDEEKRIFRLARKSLDQAEAAVLARLADLDHPSLLQRCLACYHLGIPLPIAEIRANDVRSTGKEGEQEKILDD